MDKQQLRFAIRTKRSRLTGAERERWDRMLCEQILRLPELTEADLVLGFSPLPDEPNIVPILEHLLACDVKLALPRCKAKGEMEFLSIHSLKELESGSYGILEPRLSLPRATLSDRTLCLVPGLAFTRMGDRLGQGMGYYDRFLQTTAIYAVGICYQFQILEKLPTVEHDCRMNRVLTENGGM